MIWLIKKQVVHPVTVAIVPDDALGVKKFGSEHVIPGNIIIRQRGTKWHPGENVGIGKDHTIFALTEGKVSFSKSTGDRTYVSVDTAPESPAE